MLDLAIEIAVKAHMDQIDKSGEPYILHPLRIMARVNTNRLKIIGILHDVVEDSDLTIDDLIHFGFSSFIIEAIDSLTRREDEKYFEYIDRVLTNNDATYIKYLDLEDNMDEKRIGKLDPKTRQRLLNKYNKAKSIIDREMRNS